MWYFSILWLQASFLMEKVKGGFLGMHILIGKG